MDSVLTITIHDADKIVFQGEADSISSINERGVFDVLPYHSHFISIIKTSVTVNRKGQEKKEFTIDSGIMQVHDNTVDIFLGIDVVKV